MSILTLAQFAAASRQRLFISKPLVHNGLSALVWSSSWFYAGPPGTGVSPGNTTTGVVPTDATIGAPAIDDFTGAGYLSAVEFMASTSGARIVLADRVFHAGSFTASASLSTQPSYSSRVPNGSDYKGLQLWVEIQTALTGTLVLTVNYTDQSGNAGHVSGSPTIPAGQGNGAAFQIPLAAGDSGVQKVESVAISGISAGSVNIIVARPLWSGRVDEINKMYLHPLEVTGMPRVYQDSCLFCYVCPDNSSNAPFEVWPEIASA